MKYELNGKVINIPDSDIDNYVDKLGLSMQEAIEMWLDDNDYTENAEIEQLTAKAKDNRITATIHQARAETPKVKTQRERVRKENPTKERIIAEMATKLAEMGATDVKIENIGKIITFKMDNNNYKLDLIQRRT